MSAMTSYLRPILPMERWPKLPPQDERKIVETLIEKVTIGRDEIDKSFSHLPPSEELCKNQQKLGELACFQPALDHPLPVQAGRGSNQRFANSTIQISFSGFPNNLP